MRLFILVAIALTYPVVAHAASCREQIARAEAQLRQGEPQATLPESTAAKLHHQPTPETVEKAQTEADNELKAALARARKLDSEGKDSECVAALEKVTLSPLR
jgi:hypothetical protein